MGSEIPENKAATLEAAAMSTVVVIGVEVCAPSVAVQVIVREGSAPPPLASALVDEYVIDFERGLVRRQTRSSG